MDDITTIHNMTHCRNKDDGITENQLFIHNDPNSTHSKMVQYTRHTNNKILLEKQKTQNKTNHITTMKNIKEA